MAEGLNLTFTFLGETQLLRRLNIMADRVKDLRPAFDKIHRRFVKANREQFSSQGARGPSGRWKSLSPKYAALKERRYPGQPILVRTGLMRASLTQPAHPDHIYQALPLSAVMGTSAESGIGYPYPRAHQTGSLKRPGRPPRRPPIEWTEDDKRKAVRDIMGHIHKVHDIRDLRLPAIGR